MNFENLQLNFSNIPTTEQVALKPIESNYKKVIIYSWLIFYSILLAAGILIFVLSNKLKNRPTATLIATLVFAMVIVITFLWIHIEFKFRSFAVRQHDILYKRGWIFQKTVAVPYNKIQHCSVVQGLLSRIYGLANLTIYTAASNNFDVAIRGLKLSEAQQLKDWLMQQNNNHAA